MGVVQVAHQPRLRVDRRVRIERVPQAVAGRSPRLAAAGYCVFTFTYGLHPMLPHELGSGGWPAMEETAPVLAAFVDEVRAATGTGQVDLIGHSQGAVMPRYYLERLGGASKVNRFVALAGMWRGTGENVAPLIEPVTRSPAWEPLDDGYSLLCASCAQMRSGSEYLEDLNADGEAVPGVKHINIVTRYDELVHPYTSGLMIDGGVNIVLQDVCWQDSSGHVQMTQNRAVLDLILNALDPLRDTTVRCSEVLPTTESPLR